jgi:uncharacterized protein YbjT (DUF2867 family)
MSNSIRAIITGATGMVGEGVLFECLNSPHVEQVLVINRNPCGYTHAKLKEIIHADFYNIAPIANQLTGYNACFFCLGVSSVGMKEEEYFNKTYTLTINFAKVLSDVNPNVVFCYVSGSATDSTEKGRTMWARVKGKTENDLMKLSFKKVYAFRPGYMHPTKGLKNTLSYYTYLGWLYPFFKFITPGFVSTLADLGQAMIFVARQQPKEAILEVKDIVKFSRSNT